MDCMFGYDYHRRVSPKQIMPGGQMNTYYHQASTVKSRNCKSLMCFIDIHQGYLDLDIPDRHILNK